MNNDQIHVRAEFTIEKGKIEEFKKLIQDMSKMIENAVNALPPKRRQIYRMSREEGFSHQEIADKLKISLQTVKNQVGIALKSIQDFMHKGFGGFSTFLIMIINFFNRL